MCWKVVFAINPLILLPNLGIFDEVETNLRSESPSPCLTPPPPHTPRIPKEKPAYLFFCLGHFFHLWTFFSCLPDSHRYHFILWLLGMGLWKNTSIYTWKILTKIFIALKHIKYKYFWGGEQKKNLLNNFYFIGLFLFLKIRISAMYVRKYSTGIFLFMLRTNSIPSFDSFISLAT